MKPTPTDGDTVKRLRAERCWSRAELCQRSGISYRSLTRIENGEAWKVGPRLDLVYRLAVTLGVAVDALRPIDQSAAADELRPSNQAAAVRSDQQTDAA